VQGNNDKIKAILGTCYSHSPLVKPENNSSADTCMAVVATDVERNATGKRRLKLPFWKNTAAGREDVTNVLSDR
jgi:hypothetical protein